MLRTTTSTVILFGILFLAVTTSMSATPPLPSTEVFPIQLVLDDDGAEDSFGLPVPDEAARQFMWFNSFPNPGNFNLEEIWVLFPDNLDVPLGGSVQLAVFIDQDGNPSNGADLLATYNVTIQAKDGNAFSVYPLATALNITGTGQILIGVVNRYFTTGVDPPPTNPATLDKNASQGRSYFALWPGDPPNPPDLATASTVNLLDGPNAGNLMIRGFGTQEVVETIPALGPVGLTLLATLLIVSGSIFLRRQ